MPGVVAATIIATVMNEGCALDSISPLPLAIVRPSLPSLGDSLHPALI